MTIRKKTLNIPPVVQRGYFWCAIAFLLGVILSFSLPPIYALPVLPISFGGFLIIILKSRNALSAALRGWWFGFGYFIVTFHWIGAALLVDADRFGWLAVPAVLLISAGLALFPVLVSLAVWFSPSGNWLKVLIFAFAWALSEWLRGIIFSGFPMSPIGISWTISDAMIQSVSIVGVFGLSFVTVLASALPLSHYCIQKRRTQKSIIMATGISFGILVIVWVGGEIRISESEIGYNDSNLKIRVVQANISQQSKWDFKAKNLALSKHINWSLYNNNWDPELVIWPETAVPFYISNDGQLIHLISKAIPDDGFLITGAPRTEKVNGLSKVWNSMFLLGSDFSVKAVYDKHHLVPFGEYIPLRGVFGFSNLVNSAVDFSSGFGPTTINIKPIPSFSPLICYEGIFPGNVIGEGIRPAWLLNITNDGWFGNTTGPYQHFHTARLRALEEGLPLIRAANTGISAIIDPLGQIKKSTSLGSEGIMDGYLPAPLQKPPPFASIGNWILLIVGVIIFCFATFDFRRFRIKFL
ncbi:MAG: apolipoprotein N-acyltransferase [Rhodospirillaceae bacterium]|nr:apolipoprotein N-acyltransferase [Rhodospirillaceae bacterium]|tara:strand:- start:19010 stop:20584 length:1575 start_codon:yes stop_codon:yes gene_type:complete